MRPNMVVSGRSSLECAAWRGIFKYCNDLLQFCFQLLTAFTTKLTSRRAIHIIMLLLSENITEIGTHVKISQPTYRKVM